MDSWNVHPPSETVILFYSEVLSFASHVINIKTLNIKCVKEKSPLGLNSQKINYFCNHSSQFLFDFCTALFKDCKIQQPCSLDKSQTGAHEVHIALVLQYQLYILV